MKKKKLFFGMFLLIIFAFSSCSKEEDPLPVEENQAYLSFKMSLNDQSQKQVNSNLPGCTDGIPAFLDVIISKEGKAADPNAVPIRLNINPNSTGPFEDEASNSSGAQSESLALAPGTYYLHYFTVLDENENVIWLTPINDNAPGGIDDIVGNPLPLAINLNTGVYITQSVEVICFDDRFVNQYGYLFYELNEIEVIEFCIFGNACDETGRHEEFVLYEVDVWKFSGDTSAPKGDILHENLQNEVVITDYEEYSEANSYPLCITLPDGPGLDEYYIEITRTNSGPDDGLIRSGLISDVEVRNLFREDSTMDYYHFREGNCNLDDDPELLSDHRDIVGFTCEFMFVFGDAAIAADIVFYPDGTASYMLYGDPTDTVWGTWAYYDDYLFYEPDGGQDILGFYKVSGEYNEEDQTFSGTFWHSGGEDEWIGHRKN
ncbi:MAG TPA: hypothetical protein VK941_12250 [Gillisia sp.]|nr:hypothetical protein [Gillisia sp.]